MYSTKTWFVVPLLIGIVFECVGYIFRIVSHDRTGVLIPFILQGVLLLVAPALYAASIYMVLGRLVRRIRGDRYSFIRPAWTTRIFVSGDVLSFLVQGSGGGLLASSDRSTANLGKNLIVVGLCIQIALFGFFALSSVLFHYRVRRAGPGAVADDDTAMPWQRTMTMLYVVSALILIRSIFRLIEYIGGNDGYLLSVEWPQYVFDAVLMWLATVAFLFWYPADIKPRRNDLEQTGTDLRPMASPSSVAK